jgi:hypothetical protein
MMLSKRLISLMVLFGQHFDSAEVGRQARPLQFARLLILVALCDKDKTMTGREMRQGLSDSRKKFDLVIRYGLGEADDALVLIRGNRSVRQLFEAVNKGAAKTMEAIAVRRNRGSFTVIEVFTNLLGGVAVVIQIGDKRGDCALEVDIVLPKRVVSVDEQCLTGRMPTSLRRWSHGTIIESVGGLGNTTKVACRKTSGGTYDEPH